MSRKPPARAEALLAPPLGEVLDFLRWLWAVDHGLETASKRMQVALGITGPQRLVLRLVGRFPGIRPGRLAEILHVHPSTVSGLVARLERRGLLERRRDPRDRRRFHLGLTVGGRHLDAPAPGTIEAAVAQVLGTFPPSRVAAARDVLGALALALQEGQPPRSTVARDR